MLTLFQVFAEAGRDSFCVALLSSSLTLGRCVSRVSSPGIGRRCQRRCSLAGVSDFAALNPSSAAILRFRAWMSG